MKLRKSLLGWRSEQAWAAPQILSHDLQLRLQNFLSICSNQETLINLLNWAKLQIGHEVSMIDVSLSNTWSAASRRLFPNEKEPKRLRIKKLMYKWVTTDNGFVSIVLMAIYGRFDELIVAAYCFFVFVLIVAA